MAAYSISILIANAYFRFSARYHTNQRTLREQQQRLAEAAELLRREVANAEAAEAVDGNNANGPSNTTADNDSVTPNTANAGDGAPAAPTPDSVDGDASVGSSVESVDQDDNNRLPTIALLRTFVLSFFASLIPETPAV